MKGSICFGFYLVLNDLDQKLAIEEMYPKGLSANVRSRTLAECDSYYIDTYSGWFSYFWVIYRCIREQSYTIISWGTERLVNKEGYAFINVINLKIGGSVCMLEKVCEEDVRTNGIEFNITRAQKSSAGLLK